MYLDVRVPAGMMFVTLGALLAVYGAVSDPSTYQRSLGVNINLSWGAVMIAFGAALLIWRRVSSAVAPDVASRERSHDVDERPRPRTREPHR
jgi:hypothetical protein